MSTCAAETSAAFLQMNGKSYLVTVGAHDKQDPTKGATFLYDVAEDVRILPAGLPKVWLLMHIYGLNMHPPWTRAMQQKSKPRSHYVAHEKEANATIHKRDKV